jgi:hypothetical protein
MKRVLFLVIAVAALAVVPATASAEYHFSKSGAEKVTRDSVLKRYGIEWDTSVAICRAQSVSRPNYKLYKYHRWVCTWGGIDPDFESVQMGRLPIVGSSSGRGAYYSKVLLGERDLPRS